MPWCCLTITIMTATSATVTTLPMLYTLRVFFVFNFLLCIARQLPPVAVSFVRMFCIDDCLFVLHLINGFAALNAASHRINDEERLNGTYAYSLTLSCRSTNIDSWKSGCRVDKTWLLKLGQTSCAQKQHHFECYNSNTVFWLNAKGVNTSISTASPIRQRLIHI